MCVIFFVPLVFLWIVCSQKRNYFLSVSCRLPALMSQKISLSTSLRFFFERLQMKMFRFSCDKIYLKLGLDFQIHHKRRMIMLSEVSRFWWEEHYFYCNKFLYSCSVGWCGFATVFNFATWEFVWAFFWNSPLSVEAQESSRNCLQAWQQGTW